MHSMGKRKNIILERYSNVAIFGRMCYGGLDNKMDMYGPGFLRPRHLQKKENL